VGVVADSVQWLAIENNMQWRGISEGVEIVVSREKGNVSVEASLSDQSITEARFAAMGQYLRPQNLNHAGAMGGHPASTA